jgi:hypothetical protein
LLRPFFVPKNKKQVGVLDKILTGNMIIGVLREGLQRKARSRARTWSEKPDPQGHAQNEKR